MPNTKYKKALSSNKIILVSILVSIQLCILIVINSGNRIVYADANHAECILSNVTEGCQLVVSDTNIIGLNQARGRLNKFKISGSGTLNYDCVSMDSRSRGRTNIYKNPISSISQETEFGSITDAPVHTHTDTTCIDHSLSVADRDKIVLLATRTRNFNHYYTHYTLKCSAGCTIEALGHGDGHGALINEDNYSDLTNLVKYSHLPQVMGHYADFSEGKHYEFTCEFNYAAGIRNFFPIVYDADNVDVSVSLTYYHNGAWKHPNSPSGNNVVTVKPIAQLDGQDAISNHDLSSPSQKIFTIPEEGVTRVRVKHINVNRYNYLGCGLYVDSLKLDFGITDRCQIYVKQLHFIFPTVLGPTKTSIRVHHGLNVKFFLGTELTEVVDPTERKISSSYTAINNVFLPVKATNLEDVERKLEDWSHQVGGSTNTYLDRYKPGQQKYNDGNNFINNGNLYRTRLALDLTDLLNHSVISDALQFSGLTDTKQNRLDVLKKNLRYKVTGHAVGSALDPYDNYKQEHSFTTIRDWSDTAYPEYNHLSSYTGSSGVSFGFEDVNIDVNDCVEEHLSELKVHLTIGPNCSVYIHTIKWRNTVDTDNADKNPPLQIDIYYVPRGHTISASDTPIASIPNQTLLIPSKHTQEDFIPEIYKDAKNTKQRQVSTKHNYLFSLANIPPDHDMWNEIENKNKEFVFRVKGHYRTDNSFIEWSSRTGSDPNNRSELEEYYKKIAESQFKITYGGDGHLDFETLERSDCHDIPEVEFNVTSHCQLYIYSLSYKYFDNEERKKGGLNIRLSYGDSNPLIQVEKKDLLRRVSSNHLSFDTRFIAQDQANSTDISNLGTWISASNYVNRYATDRRYDSVSRRYQDRLALDLTDLTSSDQYPFLSHLKDKTLKEKLRDILENLKYTADGHYTESGNGWSASMGTPVWTDDKKQIDFIKNVLPSGTTIDSILSSIDTASCTEEKQPPTLKPPITPGPNCSVYIHTIKWPNTVDTDNADKNPPLQIDIYYVPRGHTISASDTPIASIPNQTLLIPSKHTQEDFIPEIYKDAKNTKQRQVSTKHNYLFSLANIPPDHDMWNEIENKNKEFVFRVKGHYRTDNSFIEWSSRTGSDPNNRSELEEYYKKIAESQFKITYGGDGHLDFETLERSDCHDIPEVEFNVTSHCQLYIYSLSYKYFDNEERKKGGLNIRLSYGDSNPLIQVEKKDLLRRVSSNHLSFDTRFIAQDQANSTDISNLGTWISASNYVNRYATDRRYDSVSRRYQDRLALDLTDLTSSDQYPFLSHLKDKTLKEKLRDILENLKYTADGHYTESGNGWSASMGTPVWTDDKKQIDFIKNVLPSGTTIDSILSSIDTASCTEEKQPPTLKPPITPGPNCSVYIHTIKWPNTVDTVLADANPPLRVDVFWVASGHTISASDTPITSIPGQSLRNPSKHTQEDFTQAVYDDAKNTKQRTGSTKHNYLFSLANIPQNSAWWNDIENGSKEFVFRIKGHYRKDNSFVNWTTESTRSSNSDDLKKYYKDIAEYQVGITYGGEGHLNFKSLERLDCNEVVKFKVDVHEDIAGEECYVYARKLEISKFGATLNDDIHINSVQADNTNYGSAKTQIPQQIGVRKLFDLNLGTDKAKLLEIRNSFKYEATGHYKSGFNLFENSSGATVKVPGAKFSSYGSNIDKMIQVYDNWVAGVTAGTHTGTPELCKTPPLDPTLQGNCKGGNAVNRLLSSHATIYQDGNRAYFTLNSITGPRGGGSFPYNDPIETGTTSIGYAVKGGAQTNRDSADSHPIYGTQTYTDGDGNTRTRQVIIGYTHGGGSHTHNVVRTSHNPSGRTGTVNWKVQSVRVNTNEPQIASMLNAINWKGHHDHNEHFLIDVHTRTPATLNVSYTQPYLTPSGPTPEVTSYSGFERGVSFSETTTYTLSPSYRLYKVTGSGITSISSGGDIRGLKQYLDNPYSSPGWQGYWWHVDNWTLTLNQKIVAHLDTWRSSVSISHGSVSVTEGYYNISPNVVNRTWTLKGDYLFPSCTLLIQMPDCQIDLAPSSEKRLFDRNTLRGSSQRSIDVWAVGEPSARSLLKYTNRNPFALQTTSSADSSPRYGPGPAGYLTPSITTQGQPSYSVKRASPYQSTTGYNQPSSLDPSPPTVSATALTDEIPPATVVVPSNGRSAYVEERPTIVFEPGKYDTEWSPRWATAGRDHGGSWDGDEFYYHKCKEKGGVAKDKIKNQVYIYAEPPTCKVEDYIIHEQHAPKLETIRVTLENPNNVPMPVGASQIRVNSPSPALFETVPNDPTHKMVIPKGGSLTVKLSEVLPTYSSIYVTPSPTPTDHSSHVALRSSTYDYTAEVDKVTRQLGEFEYESHTTTYIGNEDFTTSSSRLDSIQDSWFERVSPNEEKIIGANGRTSCSNASVNKIRIVRRPYVKFYYGGLATGGQFSQSNDHSCPASGSGLGYAIAHADNDAGDIGGSSSQLVVQAKDGIYGLYSASLRQKHNIVPNYGLTLNNVNPGGTPSGKYYGGQFGSEGICIPNYWIYVDEDIKDNDDHKLKETPSANQPVVVKTPSTSHSLGGKALDLNDIAETLGQCYASRPTAINQNPTEVNLNRNACLQDTDRHWQADYEGYIYYYEGNLDIENSATDSDLGSVKATVFVDGDLYIKSNILNNRNYFWTHPIQIGYLMFIVKGNIYIDKDVDTIDALLVAVPDGGSKGQIWTCSRYVGGNSEITNGKKHWDYCGGGDGTGQPGNGVNVNKLVINGALVGRSIHFGRLVESVNRAKQPYHQATSSCLDTNKKCLSSLANNYASEEINLVPEYYLANPSFPTLNNNLNAPDSFSEMPLNF